MTENKETIKQYWEINPPQIWYSDKKPLSNEWFNEIEYKRYNVYYSYLPQVAEFENHSGEKVLEIGVGVGTDILQYAKNKSEVYGVDLSRNSVEITRLNLKRLGLEAKFLDVADAESLPFADNTFDLIFSFGVLHHTPNTEKAIAEIRRVLRPEGKAIIMLYAVGWKHFFKRIILRGILFGEFLRMGYQKTINKNTEVQGNSPLTKVYTKNSVKKLFKEFGEVEISKERLGEYFDYAPYKTKKLPGFISNIVYLFTLERLFGENWIIKAVKTEKKKRISVFKTLLKP